MKCPMCDGVGMLDSGGETPWGAGIDIGCKMCKDHGDLTEKVKATAGDNVTAEIEYRDKEGNIVGYWAYGSWNPNLPYQGE